MKIIVVIPTYNEVENIRLLVPILFEQFKMIPVHSVHVLVVDGNSPDGTAHEVTKLISTYPNLHLLIEQKKAGLGVAYACGFKYAMEELNADVIVEMDADFQHDPKDVERLIAEIDNGYDYVIGSRYIKGGSIPQEWGFSRKLQSFGGNLFSKIVLGIFSVNDFTSGFKASRVKGFMDRLDLGSILSKGFAYKLDLLFRMHRLGAKIKEVPIVFGLRDIGKSKMEGNNIIDSMRVVLTLRAKESQNFLKFVVVGFLGLFTDTGLFTIFRLFLPSNYSSASSGLIAMTVTYIMNNTWSFKERKITSIKQTLRSIVIYYTMSYVPVLFRSWLITMSEKQFGKGGLVAYTAFFIGVVIGLVWNFTVYSRIIWRRKR
jgi:dolichol-phosphate mannosyltransferase